MIHLSSGWDDWRTEPPSEERFFAFIFVKSPCLRYSSFRGPSVEEVAAGQVLAPVAGLRETKAPAQRAGDGLRRVFSPAAVAPRRTGSHRHEHLTPRRLRLFGESQLRDSVEITSSFQSF